MSKSLPARPSLSSLRYEAKQILRGLRAGDPTAFTTLRHHGKFAAATTDEIRAADVVLQDVQHALAREYGLSDWTELLAAVDPAQNAARVARYRAEGMCLLTDFWDGVPEVVSGIRRILAGDAFQERLTATIKIDRLYGLEHALEIIALREGATSWAELSLADVTARAVRLSPDHPFPTAVRNRDLAAVERMLGEIPEYANARVVGAARTFDGTVWAPGERDRLGDDDPATSTALHFAACNPGNAALAELLIRHGADVDAPGLDDRPVDLAAWVGDLATLTILLEAGADPDGTNREFGALYSAIEHDAPAKTDALLRHGAHITIHTAAMIGDVAAIERFLASDPSDLERRSGRNRTPLEEAVFYKRPDAIRFLLDAGARRSFRVAVSLGLMTEVRTYIEANQGDVDLDVALQTAVASGQLDLIRYLLDEGADANKANPSLGLLWDVAKLDPEQYPNTEIVRTLLTAGLTEANLRQPYAVGWLAEGGQLDALELVLATDTSGLNRKSFFRGITPLQECLRHPDTEFGGGEDFRRAQQDPRVIRFLLEAGADPNLRSELTDHGGHYDDMTALDIAMAEDAPEAVLKVLREFGAVRAR